MKNRRKYNKTSVGGVKLGKILNLSTRLSLGYFENLLPASKGLKGVPNFFDHLIFVSIPYIPNLRPLGLFLHIEMFARVVVGVKSFKL